MAAECYVCQGVSNPQRSVSIVGNLGETLGCCGLCFVFACGSHALRNTMPKRWECILCVLSHIAPPPGGGPGAPAGPSGPARGTGVIEEFETLYAGANPEIVERMRAAVEDADETVRAYYHEAREGEDIVVIPTPMRAYNRRRLAAAISIIRFLEIPQEFLDRHLRQHPEAVGGVRTAGSY